GNAPGPASPRDGHPGHRPHHRRGAARQHSARAARWPRRGGQPRGLADAVGYAAGRGARRRRGRRAAGDVQWRHRPGFDRAADVAFVFADRPCPALDWAAEEGIEPALVPAAGPADSSGRAAEDEILAETLQAVRPDFVVLAGYMRVLGPRSLGAFPDRMVNTH